MAKVHVILLKCLLRKFKEICQRYMRDYFHHYILGIKLNNRRCEALLFSILAFFSYLALFNYTLYFTLRFLNFKHQLLVCWWLSKSMMFQLYFPMILRAAHSALLLKDHIMQGTWLLNYPSSFLACWIFSLVRYIELMNGACSPAFGIMNHRNVINVLADFPLL